MPDGRPLMKSSRFAALAVAASVLSIAAHICTAEEQGIHSMNMPLKSATLKVPGAKLYYEVRGQGSLVLLISGGPTDAGVFANLAQHLAEHYTVVTYDPRGNSRSRFDAAPVPTSADTHGDDAARLI